MQKHAGSPKPRFGVFAKAPVRFEGENGFDPVRKIPGRRNFAGHVGVVEMAMGIDQAGN